MTRTSTLSNIPVRRLPAIECLGFAGGYARGAYEAGFDTTDYHSLDGFGMPSITPNLYLLGKGAQIHEDAEGQWHPRVLTAPYVYGNPPCAGFSLYNRHTRGMDSEINGCMHKFVRFAAKTFGSDGKRGPEIAAFESVQGAYTLGRGLMRSLRKKMETITGSRYSLTHVLMTAAAVGSAQRRPRYYWVAHRVPFGASLPHLPRVTDYYDAIWDLAHIDTQEADPAPKRAYNKAIAPTAWAAQKRCPNGVAWHARHQTPHVRRIEALLKAKILGTQRLKHAAAGITSWPEGWEKYAKDPKALKSGAFGSAVRVQWKQQPLTVFGRGDIVFGHPVHDRVLTLRETARLMGYPDAWDFRGAKTLAEAYTWLGKGVTVESGRWISNAVRLALEGRPQQPGIEIGQREYLVTATKPRVPAQETTTA